MSTTFITSIELNMDILRDALTNEVGYAKRHVRSALWAAGEAQKIVGERLIAESRKAVAEINAALARYDAVEAQLALVAEIPPECCQSCGEPTNDADGETCVGCRTES